MIVVERLKVFRIHHVGAEFLRRHRRIDVLIKPVHEIKTRVIMVSEPCIVFRHELGLENLPCREDRRRAKEYDMALSCFLLVNHEQNGSVLTVADRIILRLVIVFRILVRGRKAELLKRIQKADLQIALRGFHELEHIHAKLFALFCGKCLGKIDDTVVIIVFTVLGKTGLQLAGIPVICCRNAGKSE